MLCWNHRHGRINARNRSTKCCVGDRIGVLVATLARRFGTTHCCIASATCITHRNTHGLRIFLCGAVVLGITSSEMVASMRIQIITPNAVMGIASACGGIGACAPYFLTTALFYSTTLYHALKHAWMKNLVVWCGCGGCHIDGWSHQHNERYKS